MIRELDQALADCEAALAEFERFVPAWLTYVLLLRLRGEDDESRAAMAHLRRLEPGLTLERVRFMLAAGDRRGGAGLARLVDLFAEAGLE